MGAIRTSIVVNDGMSSALRGMNKALNIVLNSFSALESVADDPVQTAAIQSAREKLAGVSLQVDSVENEIRRAAAAQNDYTEKVQESHKASKGLLGTIKQMLVAYGAGQMASKARDTADAWSQTSARISLAAREGENVDAIQQKIFESANRARSAYMDTADVVAKMGQRAGSAFGSTDEIIAFTETLSKMYKIAGASQEEQKSSMLQLTQALGSGVLRGEEFNAVFEAAPNIMQAVADYMDVPLGKLKDLASEGQITAGIVKNAVLGAAEEVNSDFASMPATFEQAWSLFSNQALMALDPVWDKLGEISSSDDFQSFASLSGQALAVFAGTVVSLLDAVAGAAGFVADNWSVIGPIVYGVAAAIALYTAALVAHNTVQAVGNGLKAVAALRETVHAAHLAMSTGATFAATAAQYGLNAALLACPLTWILLAIIAVIAILYAVVAAINKVTGSTYSASGIIMGVLSVAVSFVMNLFLALLELVFGVVVVALGAEMLSREYSKKRVPSSRLVLAIIGVAAGVLCGLFGVGALLAAYVNRVTDEDSSFKANISAVFIVDNTFRIILYSALGLLTFDTVLSVLKLIPFAFLGLFLGIKCSNHMDGKNVKKITSVLLVLSGISLILKNL